MKTSDHDHYLACLYWILREQRGLHSGSIDKVAGWKVTRLVADVFGLRPRLVARELLELYDRGERG